MLKLLATSTCTIKRAAFSSGERDPAAATTVLTGLACTPVSVSAAGQMTLDDMTQSVEVAMETTILGTGHDIRQNDIAIVDNVTYLVTAVALWPTCSALHCTLERVRQ